MNTMYFSDTLAVMLLIAMGVFLGQIGFYFWIALITWLHARRIAKMVGRTVRKENK